MPVKNWEPPPHQQDRDRQPPTSERDEPRNFETDVRDSGVNDDAGYASAESDEINTHGSER